MHGVENVLIFLINQKEFFKQPYFLIETPHCAKAVYNVQCGFPHYRQTGL